eukprot:TRINITY_DN788_c0_g1_i3.p1 TRINITY_DN788_c0_g1~~TRINITY_DN788_c0_g1_i3.p1  ORF type:complete len:270 (-),score=33.22 TRINITY_DN788_c0_g1_i3:81-890(-)
MNAQIDPKNVIPQRVIQTVRNLSWTQRWTFSPDGRIRLQGTEDVCLEMSSGGDKVNGTSVWVRPSSPARRAYQVWCVNTQVAALQYGVSPVTALVLPRAPLPECAIEPPLPLCPVPPLLPLVPFVLASYCHVHTHPPSEHPVYLIRWQQLELWSRLVLELVTDVRADVHHKFTYDPTTGFLSPGGNPNYLIAPRYWPSPDQPLIIISRSMAINSPHPTAVYTCQWDMGFDGVLRLRQYPTLCVMTPTATSVTLGTWGVTNFRRMLWHPI